MVSSLASSSLPVLANPGLTNKLSSWMWYTATDCECYCGVRVGNVSTQTAALACSCDSIYVRIIKLRLSRKKVSRTFLSPSLFLVICSIQTRIEISIIRQMYVLIPFTFNIVFHSSKCLPPPPISILIWFHWDVICQNGCFYIILINMIAFLLLFGAK